MSGNAKELKSYQSIGREVKEWVDDSKYQSIDTKKELNGDDGDAAGDVTTGDEISSTRRWLKVPIVGNIFLCFLFVVLVVSFVTFSSRKASNTAITSQAMLESPWWYQGPMKFEGKAEVLLEGSRGGWPLGYVDIDEKKVYKYGDYGDESETVYVGYYDDNGAIFDAEGNQVAEMSGAYLACTYDASDCCDRVGHVNFDCISYGFDTRTKHDENTDPLACIETPYINWNEHDWNDAYYDAQKALMAAGALLTTLKQLLDCNLDDDNFNPSFYTDDY